MQAFCQRGRRRFGEISGLGGIHDLYPTAQQSDAIQSWVIAHNRLGIRVLFIGEGPHGLYEDTATVFPAPINLAATWNPELARRTGAAIAAETRATGVDMILTPVLDLGREPRVAGLTFLRQNMIDDEAAFLFRQ